MDLQSPSERKIVAGWVARLPLDRKFALVGSIVMLVGMSIIGCWVSQEIESSVTRNSAISTALYMESFIAPLSQTLERDDTLPDDDVERLRTLLSSPTVSDRIVSVKLWKAGGLVVFSSNPALMGQRFEPTESLRQAWRGELTASFDDLEDLEDAAERAHGVPLLEVYNPIHSIVNGEIIAVAEIYQNAAELEEDLLAARLKSWAVVASVTLGTFAALFGIVRNGSRTIARQYQELTERLAQLAEFSAQNERLRMRVQTASLRASETHERLLRRVSADLHDGPAQVLALASLRLDSIARRAQAAAGDPEIVGLRTSLDEALRDIRNLCRGLTLPEIEGKALGEVLELVIEAHERRTGSTVERDFRACSVAERGAPHSALICVYRFVQEALMNAYRHAGGAGQHVACFSEGERVEVTVSDKGAGFHLSGRGPHGSGLGLIGLRERVESIGGEFLVDSRVGVGTRLSMILAQWRTT